MKKTTILFLIFCVNVSVIMAQTDLEKSWLDLHLSDLAKKGELWSQVDYKGSPYFSNEFNKGEILCTNDTLIVNAPLRYNIYSDEIEFNRGDEKIFNLEKSIVKGVKIGDSEFIYKNFSSNKKPEHLYFEVLNQGKATLLKRHRVLFEEAKIPKPYEEAVPAQFKTLSPEFYIALGDNKAKQIFSNKKLIEILSDKKAETAEFIKKNKLKMNKQEDLIKVFQFYNSGK